MAKPDPEDIRFMELCDEHFTRFGVGYGVTIGDIRPLSEHIAILEEALRTGIPAESWNECVVEDDENIE